MAIAVHKVFTVDGNRLIRDTPLPASFAWKVGDIAAMLANSPRAEDAEGPGWEVRVTIGTGPTAREVWVPLQPFVGSEDRERSQREPVAICRGENAAADSPWLWLFRDAIWVALRELLGEAELDEAVLRIKAARFKEDEGLRRLRDQVANLEAVETLQRGGRVRAEIPEDVKLLVWTRDAGACNKAHLEPSRATFRRGECAHSLTKSPAYGGKSGGRGWTRTIDPPRVKRVLYR